MMSPLFRPERKRGFVLILVLGILLLITVLVIGFLGHTASQMKSMTSYRDQTGTLLLSDVAVNLVKAQIDTATIGSQSTGGATPNIWASQPGAIRTVDSSGNQTTYKLYSSNLLTDTKTGSALMADILEDIPTSPDINNNDWSGSALWTDLNAPTLESDGKTSAYPIIDVVNDNADLPAGGTGQAPFATGSFNVDSTPANNPIQATRTAGSTTGTPPPSPLPMPVRWLYVLKQGQVIAPDASSTATQLTFNQASTKPFSSPNIPATDNPIVGRIAFWTDDDTCRVNINTASVNANPAAAVNGNYGSFWDTPRFTSPDDLALALNQPVNKEYQRYPGHAATTTLALALPEFAPGGSATVSGTPTLSTGGTAEELIGLTPRYGPVLTGGTPPADGSEEGTVAATGSSTGLVTKTNRLYASVDELLFDPPPIAGSSSRTASSYLSKSQVEAAKFFLTAHSRAPELNLFGEPRVAIWPISSSTGSNYRTASDQLVAFCSTTPPPTSGTASPYYFTRAPFRAYTTGAFLTGSNSSTTDVTIKRNEQLLTYLDTLTAESVPGDLGGVATFDSKYTQLGMRQILTEIFDYIRITNAMDPLLDPLLSGPSGGVPYAAAHADESANGGAGDGQIMPTYYATWGTYGFGRFQGRLVEATLVFVGVGNATNKVATAQGATDPTWVTANSTYLPPAGDTAVQAMFLLTFFDPALGMNVDLPYFTVSVSGLTTLTLNGSGTPLFPATANNFETLSNSGGAYWGYPSTAGSFLNPQGMIAGKEFTSSSFPFFSHIVNVPKGSMTLGGGGSVTVSIYPFNETAGPVHTYVLNLTNLSGSIPVPGYSARPILGTVRAVESDSWDPSSFAPATTDRFDDWSHFVRYSTDANGEKVGTMLDALNDTIISLVPTPLYGDYRMLCPYASAIPASSAIQSGAAFRAHPNFPSQLSYGFEYPGGGTFIGSTQGSLVKNANYFNGLPSGVNPGTISAIPAVPATVTNPSAGSAVSGVIPPDFDNGLGPMPDGPYINKPDEGIIYAAAAAGGTAPRPYYDNINTGAEVGYQAFASPLRQVPSPVMFGSLPTGAPVKTIAPTPWQTLLFQPGAASHFGLKPPKDEYLLDLFWMPQAEPYAISEPFSTAGKVNLNYQILPFTYIDRSTGIQSVLSSERVAEVGVAQAQTYKQVGPATNTGAMGMNTPARFSLNMSEVDGTLSQFAQRFNNLDFFHSAAEICDVYLVPQGQSWIPGAGTPGSYTDTAAQTAFYGPNFALVGDNTREKPYADIYSRITTKSNSFTVYYRVQTLKNPPTADPATWTEGQGAVLGDFRGSTTLERYIDPNDTTIPDYATTTGKPNLETHYKWRVVDNTRFSP